MNPAPAEPAVPISMGAHCLFHCGGTPLAIRLDSVAEVLEVDRIVRLPLAPPEILGLCILRREVIPVVALRGPKSEVSPRLSSSALVLILRGDRGAWALKIDPTGTVVATEDVIHHQIDSLTCSILVLRGLLSREGTEYSVIDHDATWRHLKDRIDSAYSRDNGRDPRLGNTSATTAGRVDLQFQAESSPIRGAS